MSGKGLIILGALALVAYTVSRGGIPVAGALPVGETIRVKTAEPDIFVQPWGLEQPLTEEAMKKAIASGKYKNAKPSTLLDELGYAAAEDPTIPINPWGWALGESPYDVR